MVAKKSKKDTTESALPPGVKASDLKYPKYHKDNHVVETLRFYEVTTFGWCLTTLPISGGNRYAPRTYAMRLDTESVVRVGKGPHVKREITVYVTQKRQEKLQKYLDLYQKGMGSAGEIRDRTSSRRAEGQLRRLRGERSWLWSN